MGSGTSTPSLSSQWPIGSTTHSDNYEKPVFHTVSVLKHYMVMLLCLYRIQYVPCFMSIHQVCMFTCLLGKL